MSYRPYPSAVRARHQLDRHIRRPTAVTGLESLRAWSLTTEEAMANAAANLRQLFPAAVSGPGSSDG